MLLKTLTVQSANKVIHAFTNVNVVIIMPILYVLILMDGDLSSK